MNEKTLENDKVVVNGEDDILKVREEVKKAVIDDNSLTPEQQELYNKVLEEATMPVSMSDTDFKLGDNELDIRFLGKKNKEQMMFRQGVLNVVYLRQCLTTLVDVTRLLMVIANKLGVEDIPSATDEVIEKTINQNEQLKALKKAKKDNDEA